MLMDQLIWKFGAEKVSKFSKRTEKMGNTQGYWAKVTMSPSKFVPNPIKFKHNKLKHNKTLYDANPCIVIYLRR